MRDLTAGMMKVIIRYDGFFDVVGAQSACLESILGEVRKILVNMTKHQCGLFHESFHESREDLYCAYAFRGFSSSTTSAAYQTLDALGLRPATARCVSFPTYFCF
jgi:hypothetical protein